MTQEEQAAEDAAKAEAEAKAQAEARDQETEEEKKAREIVEREAALKKQYDDDLQRERKAREAAEKAAADAAFRAREGRRDDDDDKPLTRAEYQALLAEERQITQREIHRVRIDEKVRALAGSNEEANLMIEVSKNRTFPSHYSAEEIAEEVYAIANRKRLIGERNEALRALAGRDGVDRNAAGTHHDAPKGGEPKLSDADKSVYASAGFSWNGNTRRYEKKLSGGRIIIKDPKTKRVYLQESS